MPELPEVETTRRGIEHHLVGQTVAAVIVRQRQLRWPIPTALSRQIKGRSIHGVGRRGKYLLIQFDNGTLIIHLGMSGSLRILDRETPAQKHDHFDLVLNNGQCLRLRDPRRFGCVLWSVDWRQDKLIKDLGPEPLSADFNAEALYAQSRTRKVAVKNFIMNSHIVVGVGNIYASEALFRAGVRPTRIAGKLTRAETVQLVTVIKAVLQEAIKQGGTTLRDFTASDGRPGYFKQRLAVYGRAGEPCPRCQSIIKQVTLGQRASYYCPACQK
ncbi:MAG: bifunctional DNA-formamidopyrimidine glycosylase/DNA-(apurinic or apyrimidinic site) lyase [Gammaproteobacteria bacterium]